MYSANYEEDMDDGDESKLEIDESAQSDYSADSPIVQKIQEPEFSADLHYCNDCGRRYKTDRNLEIHRARMHAINFGPVKGSLRKNEESVVRRGGYICEQCGEKFRTSHALAFHRRYAHMASAAQKLNPRNVEKSPAVAVKVENRGRKSFGRPKKVLPLAVPEISPLKPENQFESIDSAAFRKRGRPKKSSSPDKNLSGSKIVKPRATIRRGRASIDFSPSLSVEPKRKRVSSIDLLTDNGAPDLPLVKTASAFRPIAVKKRSTDQIPVSKNGRHTLSCGVCYLPLSTQIELCDHLRKMHNQPANVQRAHFNSYDDFLGWKRSIERQEQCLYYKKRANACNNLMKHYYYCHLSACLEASGGAGVSRKSNKIPFNCSAFLTAHEQLETEEVDVVYCLHHYGHQKSDGPVTEASDELPRRVEDKICRMIAAGHDDEFIKTVIEKESVQEFGESGLVLANRQINRLRQKIKAKPTPPPSASATNKRRIGLLKRKHLPSYKTADESGSDVSEAEKGSENDENLESDDFCGQKKDDFDDEDDLALGDIVAKSSGNVRKGSKTAVKPPKIEKPGLIIGPKKAHMPKNIVPIKGRHLKTKKPAPITIKNIKSPTNDQFLRAVSTASPAPAPSTVVTATAAPPAAVIPDQHVKEPMQESIQFIEVILINFKSLNLAELNSDDLPTVRETRQKVQDLLNLSTKFLEKKTNEKNNRLEKNVTESKMASGPSLPKMPKLSIKKKSASIDRPIFNTVDLATTTQAHNAVQSGKNFEFQRPPSVVEKKTSSMNQLMGELRKRVDRIEKLQLEKDLKKKQHLTGASTTPSVNQGPKKLQPTPNVSPMPKKQQPLASLVSKKQNLATLNQQARPPSVAKTDLEGPSWAQQGSLNREQRSTESFTRVARKLSADSYSRRLSQQSEKPVAKGGRPKKRGRKPTKRLAPSLTPPRKTGSTQRNLSKSDLVPPKVKKSAKSLSKKLIGVSKTAAAKAPKTKDPVFNGVFSIENSANTDQKMAVTVLSPTKTGGLVVSERQKPENWANSVTSAAVLTSSSSKMPPKNQAKNNARSSNDSPAPLPVQKPAGAQASKKSVRSSLNAKKQYIRSLKDNAKSFQSTVQMLKATASAGYISGSPSGRDSAKISSSPTSSGSGLAPSIVVIAPNSPPKPFLMRGAKVSRFETAAQVLSFDNDDDNIVYDVSIEEEPAAESGMKCSPTKNNAAMA